MMADQQTMQLLITNKLKPNVVKGTLIVRTDSEGTSSDMIKFQIKAKLKSLKLLCIGENNPYLVIERARPAN
jgi:hypothetical protein